MLLRSFCIYKKDKSRLVMHIVYVDDIIVFGSDVAGIVEVKKG